MAVASIAEKKTATYKRTSLKLEMSLQKFREKVKYIVYTS